MAKKKLIKKVGTHLGEGQYKVDWNNLLKNQKKKKLTMPKPKDFNFKII